jgi:hypothetical protein
VDKWDRYVARVLPRLLERPNDEIVRGIELQRIKLDLFSLSEQRAGAIFEQGTQERRLRAREEVADCPVMLKVTTKDAVETRKIQESLELVENHNDSLLRSLADSDRELEQGMNGGDRFRVPPALHRDANDRGSDPKATQLPRHGTACPAR